ncbi:hypothetical protein FOCC_FOCC015106 [Frankliniella occidentalis]|nr:hypothetical protein FOCC_FOCC015106 [Frankliniella occidentalis]
MSSTLTAGTQANQAFVVCHSIDDFCTRILAAMVSNQPSEETVRIVVTPDFMDRIRMQMEINNMRIARLLDEAERNDRLIKEKLASKDAGARPLAKKKHKKKTMKA